MSLKNYSRRIFYAFVFFSFFLLTSFTSVTGSKLNTEHLSISKKKVFDNNLLIDALAATISSNKSELLFEVVTNGQAANTDTKQLLVTNTGSTDLNISSLKVVGKFADQFGTPSPSGPQNVPAGGSITFSITYQPQLNGNDLGYQSAAIEISSNDTNTPTLTIGLYGLKKSGLEGENEPPLQDVVNTLGININVGWTTLANSTSANLQGEEVAVQTWKKAPGSAMVNMVPVGRYSPAELLPFGWYPATGQPTPNEIAILDQGLLNAQRLYPPLKSGTTSFNPGTAEFGLYVFSNSFNRYNYSEDELNTDGVAHRARVYPLKDRQGNEIANSYLVLFEDATNGDYQDYMFVVSNVVPSQEDQEGININFALNATPSPAGYSNDIGQPYGTRGNGYTYGWLNAATGAPADLNINARNRNISGVSDLQNTLIHMQYGDISNNDTSNYLPDAKWEIAIPNGTYTVTISVGDPLADTKSTETPSHSINVEDVSIIKNFVPSGAQGSSTRFKTATMNVGVNDGKLSIDATGGYNTKINFVKITPTAAPLPFFTNVTPPNYTEDVTIQGFQINVEIVVPDGYELDKTTTADNVQLFEVTDSGDEILLPSNANDTGGGDAITLTPGNKLKAFTRYIFRIKNIEANKVGNLNDRLSFLDFESTFTTGGEDDNPVTSRDLSGVKFTKVLGGNDLGEGTANQLFSSLVIGPDGKLYASTLGDFQSDGKIQRWDILPDGRLTNLEVLSPALNGAPHPETGVNNNNNRIIIGLVFDPASTADNLIAYITHSMASVTDGPEWDGVLTRLSGPNLSTVQDLVVHLPRSKKDHLTNSVIFDKQGLMYISQGSNTAGGDPDPVWGRRKERLLSGATLKLDLKKLPAQLPLDAYTTNDIAVINSAPTNNTKMSDGTYNPYATNSPLTIFATGIRNGYDLLWHSNGWLYIPTNGTAGNNSNSPITPSTADYPLARRIDGRSSISSAPQVIGGETQKDWLFKTKGGTYHGHPNPYRGEYILNHGGKAYSGLPGQDKGSHVDVKKYPTNIGPDVNYMEPAYDFGFNKSPNGVIEYQSNAFGGKLKGLIMVVRFSGQDDLLAMEPKDNGDIAEVYTDIPGLSGFDDPLDVIEDTKTGNLYVSEYDRDNSGTPRITLLRASQTALSGPTIASSKDELLFETVTNDQGAKTQTKKVTITNDGDSALNITNVNLQGQFAGQFKGISPSGAQTLQPGAQLVYSVTYAPVLDDTDLGYQDAALVFKNNSTAQPNYSIGLYGLKKKGLEGDAEPPLQDVANTLGLGIDVGWTSLTTDTQATLKGEEVDFQQWIQATDAPVTIRPVGRYSPQEELPFGWYTNDGVVTRNQVGILDSGLENAQRLYPPLKSGDTIFDPKGRLFGIYVYSNSFNRYNYTQDSLNTDGVAHRARSYAVKDREGNPIENSYLVTFEDATNGDYQDYIFIINNVLPYNNGDLSLNFNKNKIDFKVVKEDGMSAAQKITLSANGELSADNINLTSSEPWVVFPNTIELDTDIPISVDATTLEPGTYSATVTASAPNYANDTFTVNLIVNNELDYYYQFNFQDITDKEVSPEGYIDDFGSSYGIKSTELGNLSYGWVAPGTLTPASAEANGRNRNKTGDEDVLLRTFTLIGHRQPNLYPTRDWILNIPNGAYYVNISVGGDPDFTDSNHVIDINGTNVISFDERTGSQEINFQNTKLITVTDGLMRLSLGQGGVNAKVNNIRIAPQSASQVPPQITTVFDGISDQPNNYSGSVEISLSAQAASEESSITALTYVLDELASQEYNAAFTVSTLGDHKLLVTAEDSNGNKTTNTYNFSISESSGALLYVENMTKIPGTDRGFPADDYYTYYRLGDNKNRAKVHDQSIMRINNTGTGDLLVNTISISDSTAFSYTIVDDGTGNTLPLTITPGSHRDLKIMFIGATTNGRNKLFKEAITIATNADNSKVASATLHGGFAPQPEQDGNGVSDEINAQEVFDAFGFKTNMSSIVNENGTITPPNPIPTRPGSLFPTAEHVEAGYEGDLIIAKSFVQADPAVPIYIVQMSGLHGYTTANAKFIEVNGTATVGGVSATQSRDYYQTLLPKNNSGQLTSDMATSISGPFRIAIENYVNTGGNNLKGTRPDLLGLRIYKVVDRNGKVVPNEYIALQDYIQNGCGAGSANCDWNDNTFYIANVRPSAVPTSKPISSYYAEVGTDFTYGVSYAFDHGYAGNKLTYSALMQDGSKLPSWLYFNTTTGTFSGNPPTGSVNNYNINVTAKDLNGLTTSSSVTIIVSEQGSVPDIDLKINAGGPTTAYDEKTFVADTYFQGGKSFVNNSAAVPELFKSERSDAINFGYNIPVPNGIYTITLHFAEIYWGANGGGPGGIGKRIFDVNLEDKLVLDNYDITKDVGAQNPVAKTYIVNVTDGVINLNLSADPAVGGKDFPMISALEVLSGKAVNKAPVAVASGTPTSGYAPLPVSFRGSKSSDDEGVVSYNWTLNGTNISTKADFEYQFTDPGDYDIMLTVTDREGLKNVDTVMVNVIDPGNPADFAIRINAGGPTLTYNDKEFIADNYFTNGKTFTNASATVPDLYQSERSSSTRAFGYEIPVPNGNYTVVLHFAEIYFGATGGGAGGTGKRVFDVSIENKLSLDNYDINADVGPQTTVTKSFTTKVNDRILNIDLSALSAVGGTDQPKISAIEILGIAPANNAPVALAKADKTEGTVPLTVNFTGSGSTDDKAVVSYQWKIDGVNISTNPNFAYNFTEVKTYTVTLEVKDAEGLSDIDTLSIKVNNALVAPIAVAKANVKSGNAPLSVSFNGEESSDDVGIESYSWSIDSAIVSTDTNFDYTFEEPGSYQVTLTVTDGDGLTGTDSLTIQVSQPGMAPVAIATSDVSEGSAPLDVSFTGENSYDDLEISSYSWKIDGVEVSTDQNFIYTFSDAGTYEVTLTVTDADGLTGTDTLSIQVSAMGGAPVAVATSDIEQGNAPLAVSFKGESSADDVGIEGYSWTINGDIVSTDTNFDYTFEEPGTYTVSLTVTDGDGLTDTDTLTILVSQTANAPVAIATYDVGEGSAPLDVFFTGEDSHDDIEITAFSWKMNGVEISTEQNFNYTFNEIGTFEITLTVTDNDGLTDTETLIINVLPKEEGEPNVIIFPNPTKTSVTVRIENAPRKITNVTLIDSRGRIIQYFKPIKGQEQSEFKLDLPILSSGMYLLMINDDKGETYQERMIIKNTFD